MAVIEKFEAQRKFKFNGRDFERGDPIDRDYIMSVEPHKLGTLLRTNFIAPAAERPLSEMSMDDLRSLARDAGLTGPLPRRKDDLVEAIESEM